MAVVTASAGSRKVAWERRRQSMSRFWRAFRRDREGVVGLIIIAIITVVAVAAPLWIDAKQLSVVTADGPIEQAPTWSHLLGTDNSGRDVLNLVIWGGRSSLIIGLAATFITMVLGAALGIMAGHFGGAVGFSIDRFIDWFLVIPFLPLAIALSVTLRNVVPHLLLLIIVIGVTSWPSTARMVRAQTLAVEGRPYMERAKALGAGHWQQMSRHVLPNVMPLVLANTTLTVSIAILTETTLTFLGFADTSNVTWGSTLSDVYDHTAANRGLYWWVLSPGIAVVVVVRAFYMCGRAMERILDPRLAGRGAA